MRKKIREMAEKKERKWNRIEAPIEREREYSFRIYICIEKGSNKKK